MVHLVVFCLQICRKSSLSRMRSFPSLSDDQGWCLGPTLKKKVGCGFPTWPIIFQEGGVLTMWVYVGFGGFSGVLRDLVGK